MKFAALFLILLFLPCLAAAQTPGQDGVKAVHRCVMENNPAYCRSVMTPGSTDLFNRFVSYKLMPCLPTDFTYAGEESSAGRTTAKVTMPAGGGNIYVVRLVFVNSPSGTLLDIPASFARGLGPDWQNKIQLSEQLYLMMRQNMGDKLTCDMLTGLIKKN